MQRAWVAVLGGLVWAGCGFHSTAAHTTGGDDDGSGTADAAIPGDGSSAKHQICLALKDSTYKVDWAGCADATPADKIDIQTSTTLDTMAGSSGILRCVVITVTVKVDDKTERTEVCALAATSITLRADATLRAKGARPLVLVGDSIDIEGRIDVASHATERGAGSDSDDCAAATPAMADGGGAGGSFGFPGGAGGDQGNNNGTGGTPGTTLSASYLRGGCDGAPGGDGSNKPPNSGGLAGGVVWVVSNAGMLKIGSGAYINASGAGGLGGKQSHYGGAGGGAGGMIVLQSTAIQRDSAARIFANGGHGGGGDGDAPGQDGGDPDTASSGGTGGGGDGGGKNGNNSGNGGKGYAGSSAAEAGSSGSNSGGGFGGGGGGGGGGAIRVASASSIGNNNTSPDPVQWTPEP